MEYTTAKMRDKIRICEKTGKEMHTFFLTPAEVQEIMHLLRGYEYTLSGGFEEAERRMVVIGNDNADLENYLTVIRVESFQKPLTHRSVLGSVLGLGMKREMIGDIIVKDKICDIIIIQEMKKYILNELHKVGSQKVEVYEVKLTDLLQLEDSKEVRTLSVASLRVDALISVAFGISREKSSLLVTQEKVLVNFLPCTNQAKAIKEEDLISVRGFRKSEGSRSCAEKHEKAECE